MQHIVFGTHRLLVIKKNSASTVLLVTIMAVFFRNLPDASPPGPSYIVFSSSRLGPGGGSESDLPPFDIYSYVGDSQSGVAEGRHPAQRLCKLLRLSEFSTVAVGSSYRTLSN